MEPTLHAGDFILVAPIDMGAQPLRLGDLVVCPHPFQRRMIVKRVASIAGDQVALIGDNPDESHDSRGFGSVAVVQLLGRVTSKL